MQHQERLPLLNSMKNPLLLLRKGKKLLILTFLWSIGLFCMWDVRQFLTEGVLINGLTNHPFENFSNFSSWRTLANEVARGNFFLTAQSLNGNEAVVYSYPYFSLWIYGGLIHLLGGAWATIIGGILFSSASLVILVLIYRCYLPWRWSVTLSAFGAIAFIAWPFRAYISGLINGDGWPEMGAITQLDIMGMPFPSISLCAFLIAFYISIKRVKPSVLRMAVLTAVWVLQAFFHPVNALFGVPFWIAVVAIDLYRLKSRTPSFPALKVGILVALIAIMSLIPVIYVFGGLLLGESSQGGLLIYASSSNLNSSATLYFYFAYFIFPLFLLGLIYYCNRVDPYELGVKFLPIWVAMALEFTLALLWDFAGIGLPTELIMSRLSMFFLHLFYFVPFIYYLSRPSWRYHDGIEGGVLAKKIRKLSSIVVQDGSLVILPLIIIMLSFYTYTASEAALDNYVNKQIPAIRNIERQLDALQHGMDEDAVLVSSTLATNFAIIVNGSFKSLLVNRFVDSVSIDEALERLALFAHLVGWSKQQFLIMFKKDEKKFSKFGKWVDLTGSTPVIGLGTWLLFNRKLISEQDRENISRTVSKVYDTLNVSLMIKKYNVKKLYLDNIPTNEIINNGTIAQLDYGYIVLYLK